MLGWRRNRPSCCRVCCIVHSLLAQVLCMTVVCGFGGQKFQEHVLEKVRALRAACPALDIQVDGGVNEATARLAAAAGANVLVAGTAVFAAPGGPTSAIAGLRRAVLQEGLAAAAAAGAAVAGQQAAQRHVDAAIV